MAINNKNVNILILLNELIDGKYFNYDSYLHKYMFL